MILSRDEESDLDIELDKLKKNDYTNQIFYIRYALSRATKLLSDIELEPEESSNLSFIQLLQDTHEIELIHSILYLDLQFKKTMDLLKPSILASYLYSLAKSFHIFYEHMPIKNEQNIELKMGRIALVQLVHRILKEMFSIFKISDASIGEKYYSHLQSIGQKSEHIEIFITKAEKQYLSCAISSIISRYHFIEEISELSKKVSYNLPLGATRVVKEAFQKFSKNTTLKPNKYCKLHFKTFKECTE
ncbi:ribonuclease HII [Plasmodium vivax North Korean]|uniref:arginine--tRNA ligase n=1 Tax=Plasmodium vivax North Korean TaxID=1035514 RepID=A0A0J9TKF9_PLAVI|nr:ribonuclease HII [Plasmodium vivax North Korean]